MNSHLAARLTEQQRACLRLVYVNMTSKEIAPHLGIEPNSVDQHIKAAMRTLGVGDRRSAARLLADYEGRPSIQSLVYQPSAYQPSAIATEPDPARLAPWSEGEAERPGGPSGEVPGPAEPDFPSPAAARARWPRLPLPIWGDRPDDLSVAQRLGWVLALMLVIALTFGVFLAGLDALARLGS
jgi:DNA-binding CsgD family transcriptional regulator